MVYCIQNERSKCTCTGPYRKKQRENNDKMRITDRNKAELEDKNWS